MHIFEILPLEAIGPACLGATRLAAREAMAVSGFPLEKAHDRLDYFCDASVQLEYGTDEKVQFIGVSGNAKLRVIFRGVNVFNLPAAELFLLMASADDSGPHEFNSYEYCFPNQILTLWDADAQHDRNGGEARPIWGQVGIGNNAYLAAIEAIAAKA